MLEEEISEIPARIFVGRIEQTELFCNVQKTVYVNLESYKKQDKR